ncbi:hypothetical protein P1X14_04085 [Sphingomonas sp. AOB5]|uniref:hypothetical protein n=1 Tax=Sphingomonas sp. AOB5 TaxID=3034017 RepID=UPI0023F87225|nr:hypothetical protein [Sphingomonas sp. AOB5]MDF7774416.1 hypothetical protein [Sphingomonas sp. AOB5]
MNLTIPEMALFFFAILLARFGAGRAGLFLLWPILVLIFPTARLFFGFPLYLYDFIVALMLFEYRREYFSLRWGGGRTPWHYVFFVLIVVSGIAWPLVAMPVNVQTIWVAAHALLTFSTIGLVALVFADSNKVRERKYLGYGLIACVVALGVIGLLQFGSPASAGRVAQFFYRDFGADAFLNSKFYAQIAAQRAAGPYGSPNILGVVAVIAAIAVTLLVRSRVLILITFGAASIAILSSVSRQAMIGAIVAAVAYFILSRGRSRLNASVVAIAAAPLLVVAFLASDYSTTVLERFSRWDQGIQQDDNFTARYVDGPARLAETIGRYPSILLLGTGPDIGKLASSGVPTDGREYGFVSISYVLFLFQYGVIGLIAGIAMHIQGWRNLRYVPVSVRARLAAMLAAVYAFYLADNAPNVSESVTMLCLLPIGIGAGCALQALQARRVASAAQPFVPRSGSTQAVPALR